MFETIIPILGALVPPLKKSVGNAAVKYLENRALKGLGIVTQDQNTALTLALGEAYAEWLAAVIFQLQGEGWDEDQIQAFFPAYAEALDTFLKDEEVAQELLKPFHSPGGKITINADKLLARWAALGLRPLPEDFDAFDVGKSYLKRLEKARIVQPEFRDLLTAQHIATQSGLLDAIRGAWPDFDLDDYAKRLKTRYRVLDLAALTPPERDDQEKPQLRDIFIAPHVKESRPPHEIPKGLWERAQGEAALLEKWSKDEFRLLHDAWRQKEREPVLEMLGRAENRLLVILGDPGSGKSTLARYLLLSCLEQPQPAPDWLNSFTARLPLLVELREYIGVCTAGACQCFLEYFHYLGKAQGYALNHLALKDHLKDRPSLLIFDGLDEIFEARAREQIIQQIIGVASDYPLARIVVTSRIIGYHGQALQAADFCEYTLQDLDPAQIETFAQGWYRLIYAEQPTEAQFRVERIRRAVQSSPAIRQLAGNPLLLTMIAIIAKHQELPRERVKLYDHAARVLCHHWDVTGHKISRDELPAEFMREDDKLELLRRLAKRMQNAPEGLAGNFIAGNDLREEIESYLQQRWKLEPTKSAPLSEAILAQLRERNFILCLSGPNLYSFVHRTFLEYFSAAEIVERFEKEQSLSFEELKKQVFLEYYRVPAWHEVLRLISGMIAPRFAEELIVAITPRQDLGKSEILGDLILATQCLAELADVQNAPIAAERVLVGIGGWFDGHDFSPDDDTKFLENAVPAIESIGKHWPGRERHVAWLAKHKKLLSLNRAGAFGRITAALWADLPDTRQRLIELSGKDYGSPYMAFDALARCYKTDTDAWLQEKVRSGETAQMRRIAVETLVRHYKDTPDTLPLLRMTAESDPDGTLRCRAAGILIRDYQEQDFALPLLKRLLHDANVGVRRVAVEEIARAGGNETWEKLLSEYFTAGIFGLDSQATIDEERVLLAAEELKMTPEAVRVQYEEIAREIPLHLAWLKA